MKFKHKISCISYKLNTLLNNNYISQPTHIKIDVDGLEYLIIENGLDVELSILQEGPELRSLKKLVKKRGLQKRVHFLGKLPALEDVYDRMREADAVIHPAVNEAFGQSVLESLAVGRQVICLDWAGPGMIVTDKCGIKVSPGNRETIVRGLADAIVLLGERRGKWEGIQQAAIERAGEFSWHGVARELDQAYRDSLIGR